MGKNQSASNLPNIVLYDTNGNLSFVSGSTTLLSVSSSGALTTNSTITARTLVVQTITSSISAITGSTKFGILATNTHQFTGSLFITGAFYIPSGSVGIGINNPTEILEVKHPSNDGATKKYVFKGYDNTGNINGIALRVYDTAGGTSFADVGADYFGTGVNTNLTFSTRSGSAALTERMRITNLGNVQIDSGQLNVPKSLYFQANSSVGGNLGSIDWYNVQWDGFIRAQIKAETDTGLSNGRLVFSTGGGGVTERMRITSGGVVAIATTGKTWESSYRALEIGNGFAFMAHNTNSDGYVASNTYYDGAWRVSSQNNVRLSIFRVYNGLNLETGNTTASVGTAVATTSVFTVAINGNVTNLNNSYGQISDIKLKENIVDASPKLEDLMKVRIVNYNLKSDLGYDSSKQIGVIAQELEQVFPGLVDEQIDTDKEGNDLGTTTKSVKYSVFVPMLVKAIQELKAEIDELKNNK